jgi:hypothetical protein
LKLCPHLSSEGRRRRSLETPPGISWRQVPFSSNEMDQEIAVDFIIHILINTFIFDWTTDYISRGKERFLLAGKYEVRTKS